MSERIRRLISEHYGLDVKEVVPTSGGWSAAAYAARTDTADYFVKVYDRHRPSVLPWIARMPAYMALVFWLYENSVLRDRMVAPLRTMGREYKVESGQHVLLVFPMLHGTTLSDTCLDAAQAGELALILAQLHACERRVPRSIATKAIREDYVLPFLPGLVEALKESSIVRYPREVLRPHVDAIRQGMTVLQELAVLLRDSRPNEVLCHADVHGGNLMWTDKIVLVDWEGLRLAPAEADLFAFTEGFFFDYATEAFMSAYRSIRKDYADNGVAMRFYRLRRRMEDIAEFSQSLLHDRLSPLDADEASRHMEKECVALSAML